MAPVARPALLSPPRDPNAAGRRLFVGRPFRATGRLGSRVGREKIKDADGKPIPAQDLYIVELANGFNYAVRGSGTEPKIKFYLFGKAKVKSAKALPGVKAATKAALEELRQQIEADAAARAER